MHITKTWNSSSRHLLVLFEIARTITKKIVHEDVLTNVPRVTKSVMNIISLPSHEILQAHHHTKFIFHGGDVGRQLSQVTQGLRKHKKTEHGITHTQA